MPNTIKDLQFLAKQISKKVKLGDSVFLYGDLGTGKTTFSQFLIKEVFKKNKKKSPQVTSPTFNVAQYYPIDKKKMIAHYDLYRLKKTKDLEHIGIFELQDSVISLIEWPELIKKKNKNRIEIKLKHSKIENQRDVTIKYFGRLKK